MNAFHVIDLAGVVYSSAKVFEGLLAGRRDVEEFLRTGDTSAVNSMHDLSLLLDLKQAVKLAISHGHQPVNAKFLTELNASMTRSASIQPGVLRTHDEKIGVSTVFGRHEPPAITMEELDSLVGHAVDAQSPASGAARLFLAVAKAQPFKDGNKRTGVFAANALLIGQWANLILTIPVDDDDPNVARHFNELLARAYLYNEDGAVIDALLNEGIKPLPSGTSFSVPNTASEKLELLKAKIARRAQMGKRPGRPRQN